MPERFGPRAADAAVLVFVGRNRAFALGFDAGKFQLLPQHLGQFFERDFDFANVASGLVARLSLPVAVVLPFADRGADIPFSLSDPAGTFIAVAEVGDFDVGDGDADVLAPLAADHFAMRNILPQILADFPAHNLLESLLVVIDGPGHVLLLVPALCMGTRVQTVFVA
jgi:hypothetical protein